LKKILIILIICLLLVSCIDSSDKATNIITGKAVEKVSNDVGVSDVEIADGFDCSHELEQANNIIKGLNQRKQALAQDPIDELETCKEFYSVKTWRDIQEWFAQRVKYKDDERIIYGFFENPDQVDQWGFSMPYKNVGRFVDPTVQDWGGKEKIPYLTVSKWRKVAGLHENGFRKVIRKDAVGGEFEFEYGLIEKGDVIGDWILEDIKKGLDALETTYHQKYTRSEHGEGFRKKIGSTNDHPTSIGTKQALKECRENYEDGGWEVSTTPGRYYEVHRSLSHKGMAWSCHATVRRAVSSPKLTRIFVGFLDGKNFDWQAYLFPEDAGKDFKDLDNIGFEKEKFFDFDSGQFTAGEEVEVTTEKEIKGENDWEKIPLDLDPAVSEDISCVDDKFSEGASVHKVIWTLRWPFDTIEFEGNIKSHYDTDGDGDTDAPEEYEDEEGGDCDDDPSDDPTGCPKSYEEIKKKFGLDADSSMEEREAVCFGDSDNDGIGDYVACSFCRVYGMTEKCDNVDNDCEGRCQGGSGLKSCEVSGDYSGDGADSVDCNGLKTQGREGLEDTFCQMVDENVFAGKTNSYCRGYNRCVLLGIGEKRDFTSEKSDELPVEGYQKWIVNYKMPGSIPGNKKKNTYCGFKEVTEHVYCLNELVPDFSKADDETSPYGCSSKTTELVKYDEEAECLPYSEGSVKLKDTEGTVHPDQFIDSAYGEIKFDKFWDDLSQDIKDELEWETTCVPKDKCNDGVDNDGSEDLFIALPYSFFISDSTTFVVENHDGSFERVSVGEEFQIKLVDVDDPGCKFKDPDGLAPAPYVSKEEGEYNPLPEYKHGDYKTNPLTGKPYCYDRDKDGFCGCPEITYDDEGNSECDEDAEDVHGEKVNKEYLQSKQFPDCVDNHEQMKLGQQIRGYIYPGNLWPDEYSSEYSLEGGFEKRVWWKDWNIHPLAPISEAECWTGMDHNCNKDFKKGGSDLTLLVEGKTPFDYNIKTGQEIHYSHYDLLDLRSLAKKEIICYDPDPVYGGIIKASPTIAMIMVAEGLLLLNPVTATGLGIFHIGHGIYGTGSSIYKNIVKPLKEGKGVTYENADSVFFSILLSGLDIGWGYGVVAANIGRVTTAVSSTKGLHIKGATGRARARNVQSIKIRDAKKVPLREPSRGGNTVRTPKSGVPKNIKSCFLGDTLILMADNTTKQIKDVRSGDKLFSWSFEENSLVESEVGETWNGTHEEIYKINGYIDVTSEHPFYTKEKGWASINSSITKLKHGWKPNNLEIGDHLMDYSGKFIEITSIEENYGNVMTYNLLDVEGYNNYFADNVLVHNKAMRVDSDDLRKAGFIDQNVKKVYKKQWNKKTGYAMELIEIDDAYFLLKPKVNGAYDVYLRDLLKSNPTQDQVRLAMSPFIHEMRARMPFLGKRSVNAYFMANGGKSQFEDFLEYLLEFKKGPVKLSVLGAQNKLDCTGIHLSIKKSLPGEGWKLYQGVSKPMRRGSKPRVHTFLAKKVKFVDGKDWAVTIDVTEGLRPVNDLNTGKFLKQDVAMPWDIFSKHWPEANIVIQ